MPESIQNWLSRSQQILLDHSKQEDVPLLLQVLLAFHLNTDRPHIISHPEQTISDDVLVALNADVQKLAGGYPLPYLLGSWEFYGLQIKVTPDVLIPRPETELLVENCIQWLKNQPTIAAPSILDLGTGSGCIPIAICKQMPGSHAIAADLSFAAIKVAKCNAESQSVDDRIGFLVSDLCTAIEKNFHVVTANLPYIPSRVLDSLDVAKYEPRLALDGGNYGTELMDELLTLLPKHLRNPGLILLEHQDDQWEHLREIAAGAFPSGTITKIKDYSGKDRILRIELL